jgi:hypothetical protein
MEKKHVPQKLQGFHGRHFRGRNAVLWRTEKWMGVRSGLISQGLQEKEVSILPLLLFQFFGRQPSAIRERIIDGDIPQRICLL